MGGDGSRAPGVERVEAGREGAQRPPSPPVAPSPRREASAVPRALGRAPGQRVNVPVPRRVAPGRAGSASPLVALAGDGGLGEGTGVRHGHGPTVPTVPRGRGEWGWLSWRGRGVGSSAGLAPRPRPHPCTLALGGLPRGLTAFLQLFILVWPSSSFLPQLGFAGHGVL